MQKESSLLLGALGWAVTEKKPALHTDVDWKQFLYLAQLHKLEPLVYDGLQKAGVWDQIPKAAQKQLTDAYMLAIYRDIQRDHIKSQLQKKLIEANITHIFLKGICLKDSYPVPALRTMCDIDILVHTEDYAKLDQIVISIGGQSIIGDGNHKNYHFPRGVSVEFHPNLLHHATPVGTQINPGWQYAEKNASCAMTLTPEGFYLNTICHLANHFVAGGVGVRFILDVWVNQHLRKPAFDRSVVDNELNKFRLLNFAQTIEDLAQLWFADGENTPLLEELSEYILTSGCYGNIKRSMLNAVSLSSRGNRLSALWKKAFFSRQELEDRFPWCKKTILLLPIAWCVRAYLAVTVHGNHIVKWSKGTGEVTQEDVTNQREKLSRFGINLPDKK